MTGVGIENLSVDVSALTSGSAGIEMFENTAQCWVKGIRSINGTATGSAANSHIALYIGVHDTVRDSYFYGSNPGSGGYGTASTSVGADNLVENNILQHMATGTIAEGCTGCVYGYNYAVDNYFGNPGSTFQQDDESHHSAGDSFLLWEGHEGIGFDADTIHGTSWMITHFRNYLNGRDPAAELGAPKNTNTFAYQPMAYSRYFNLVGSVLGTSSYHTTYQSIPASGTDCGSNSQTIVMPLGWSNLGGTWSNACQGRTYTIYSDLLVASTLMRWGNYAACTGDAACNAVRWVAGENASGAPTYPGLSNPSQTLPASFYLSSKPSWWGTMPWPAVGPDVTGGNVASVAGHVYHNPAANCYLNVMGGKTDGSSGQLTFNADDCYSSGGGGLTPPSNLVIVVH